MFRTYLAGVAVALIAMLCASAVPAQEVQEPQDEIAVLEADSRAAYEAGKHLSFFIANRKLNELRPYEPEYLANMVRACALMGRRNNAFQYMLTMQQQGLAYDFDATEDTKGIRDSEAYTYINKLLVEAAQPAGDGAVAFTIPGEPSDYQAIAWDEGRQKFLVGTLSEGRVIAVGDDGKSEVLLQANKKNGLWSIYGLAVDAERKRLWVASSATTDFSGFSPAVKAGSALSEFNLETLELVKRYELPADQLEHKLGSVAVTTDGHVYVIDRVNPIVYRKTPVATELEAFVASKELTTLTDITVSPDNGRLFVSDAAMGIWVIDPGAQAAMMLVGPETLNQGGIGGLEFNKSNLIIMQSDISPQRLMRLSIDNTGAQVGEVSPMAIALEPFDRPGKGVIRGDSLYYFANQGSEDSKTGAIVMRTPLDAGSKIESPDMRVFKESMEQQPPQQQQP
jgi:hypothetical protein